jgi:hypothetical protein
VGRGLRIPHPIKERQGTTYEVHSSVRERDRKYHYSLVLEVQRFKKKKKERNWRKRENYFCSEYKMRKSERGNEIKRISYKWGVE